MSTESLAIVDTSTGELIKADQEKFSQTANPYEGASMNPVSSKQQEVLLGTIDPNDVEIKPDGIVYLPQIKYRRKLNNAFCPMGWSMIPRGDLSMKGNCLYRSYALIVGGRFVAEAIGSQEYYENNGNMNYADAAEGVKSNALERCCKDLGIASEMWDPSWIAEWKKDYAIEVSAPNRNNQMKNVWRRKDRQPFKGEREANDFTPPQTTTTTNQPSQSQSTTATADPRIISDAQRKRLYAISKNSGYSDDQLKKIIEACGYKSSSDVLKKHYEAIVDCIEGTPVEQFSRTIDVLSKWCKEN
jgi:hypothetical protein